MTKSEEILFLKGIIDKLNTMVKSLKGCSNCKHSLTKSQIGLEVNIFCKSCIGFSSWELE